MVRAIGVVWFAAGAGGVGCAGDAEEAEPEPVETYACVHVADGDLVDVSHDRAASESIAVGREPYRMILVPDEAGYVAFSTAGPADLVLQLDFAAAVKAVWNGDERVALEPGEPNPNCDSDIVEVDYLSVPAGDHALEVGPAFQATVWAMLSEP
ncbi:MAG: hypothetical protein ABMB14_37270 [Myxococcota bacterium]